jgi:hypothetical protein
MAWKLIHDWREPRYLLEIVLIACALPLVLAYRLEPPHRVGAGETLTWGLLAFAVASAIRTFNRAR